MISVTSGLDSSRPPLLLLHGICNNSAVWGPILDRGLESRLSSDFFPIRGELTGGRPSPGCPGWDFDFHLSVDMPRIWKAALKLTGGRAPFVLGYSMGGMLALFSQARCLIEAPRLMVMGAPFVFSGIPFYPPLMRGTLFVAKLLRFRMIPVRLAAKLIFLYQFIASGCNYTADLNLFHALIRRVAVDVPIETLDQATRWVTDGRCVDHTGGPAYPDDLACVTAPVLFLAGENDRIVPPASMRPGFDRISSNEKRFEIMPNATHLSLIAPRNLDLLAGIIRDWFLG
ncbi:MAG: alpha/beta hydrolase [Candidatus Riflebacteria bacterium]|nr:alpha/beta hydrolase [Candidatus Riflebacteria bacterium]